MGGPPGGRRVGSRQVGPGRGGGGGAGAGPRAPQYLAVHTHPARVQRVLTQARGAAQLVLPRGGVDDLEGRVAHRPVDTEVGRLPRLPRLRIADAWKETGHGDGEPIAGPPPGLQGPLDVSDVPPGQPFLAAPASRLRAGNLRGRLPPQTPPPETGSVLSLASGFTQRFRLLREIAESFSSS